MLMTSLDQEPKHTLAKFAHYDRDLLDRMFGDAKPERYAAGRLLFLQDDPSDRVYGLLAGSVEISIFSAEGDKLVANLQFPPSLIGEIGVLDGGVRTATAICRSECSIVSLTRKQMLDRIDRDPLLGRAIIELLCKRLRWISEELGDHTFLAIEARLAKRLLHLSERLSDASGWIAISQSELAQTLGATRESVNKLLNDWRGRGLIATKRGHVKVNDAARLRRVSSD
ncbi:Crp/Fnr family transcriptional regulator [Mesorhizobium sp. NPDC059054]|uniref:Crp/Fnr family transcriptional regulator n=1 Tax=Mesorhizobium sp. NPDC059054 TaxID=3346711 RepID=UPI0036A18002